MEKVEAHPVRGFDDLDIIEPIEQLDWEVMGYRPFPPGRVSNYDPNLDGKVQRPGCEYESSIRQRCGEPDLEVLQAQAQEQMLLQRKILEAEQELENEQREDDDEPVVKKKIVLEKDIVSGANVSMPKGFLMPFDFSLPLILGKHPSLRRYRSMVE